MAAVHQALAICIRKPIGHPAWELITMITIVRKNVAVMVVENAQLASIAMIVGLATQI
jgi:hypothetical protein